MDRTQQNLSAYADVTVSGVVLATDDLSVTPRVLAAAKAAFCLCIQRIVLYVTTDNAATQTFSDTAGTPLKVVVTKASPGIGVISIDFGPDGFVCTDSKGFNLSNSAAGLAYSYVVQMYQKRSSNSFVSP